MFVEDEVATVKIQDITLGSGKTLEQTLSPDTAVLIIPLMGSLGLSEDTMVCAVPAGEAFLVSKTIDTTFSLTNPYSNDLIAFLLIRIPINLESILSPIVLSLDQHLNELQLIFQSLKVKNAFHIYLGKYEGRKSGTLPVGSKERIYVFVIGGAFEAQNRLLQERDGLVLSNINQLEYEALSKEGILLILKTS